MLSFYLVFGFVYINSRIDLAAQRFVDIIEQSKFKNLTKEYLTLANNISNEPTLTTLRIGYLYQALRQPPYNKADSLIIFTDLGQLYLDQNKSDSAQKYINYALITDSLDLNSHLLKQNFINKYGNESDLQQLAVVIENRFPQHPLGQMNAGIIYLQIGDTDNGGKCLKKAYQINNRNYIISLNYGIYMLQIGNYQKCLELMEEVINENRKNFLAYYYASVACYYLNDRQTARTFIEKAKELAINANDSAIVSRLQHSL